MKTQQSAGIVVFYKHNNLIEYLLLHYAAGHWDFPKGHIEPGETKEQAAHRELLEETGLQATIVPGFKDTFDYFLREYNTEKRMHKTVYFFVGETKNKNVTLSHEHQDYGWLPFEQAMQKLTYQNARVLLKKVEDFLKEMCNDHKTKSCGVCSSK